MNGIDLFSGIGGFALALKHHVKTTLFCEKDKICAGILKVHFPEILLHDDVTTLADHLRVKNKKTFYDNINLGKIDIVCGGFPCQDISCNNNTPRGIHGKKSGLFFAAMDVVRIVDPTFIFLENVPPIRVRGLREVVQEVCAMGYTCRWGILSAHDVGAPHMRKRWYFLATKKSADFLQSTRKIKNADGLHLHIRKRWRPCWKGAISDEPDIYEPTRSSPLHNKYYSLYGNAVCPIQCRAAFDYMHHFSSRGKKTMLRDTEEMPSFGSARMSRGHLCIFTEQKWNIVCMSGTFDDYPTVLYCQRVTEGPLRIARKMFLQERISLLNACALAGKCPHLGHSSIAQYKETIDFDRCENHTDVCGKNFTRHKNFKWAEWLMGFPKNYIK